MTSGATNNLEGVWGSSDNDIFAIGGDGNIIHYDGISWIPMTSRTTDHLYGIWGSSGTEVFAVGDEGTTLYYGDILYVSEDGNCGTHQPCYSKIEDALNGTESVTLIKVKRGTYKETPTKNTPGTVIITGGWNDTFTDRTGTTEIYAPKAAGGTVKVRPNIKVVAPQ